MSRRDAVHEVQFDIHISDQNDIVDNLDGFDEEERRRLIGQGLLDEDVKDDLSERGWKIVGEDIEKLNENSLAWLRRKFEKVIYVDRNSEGSFMGSFLFDVRDPKQADLVHTGLTERIDMLDASYGDLANSVWDSTSEMSRLLSGSINFDADDKGEILEAIERRLAWERTTKRREER